MTTWLPPIIVTAGIAVIGWLIRYVLSSLTSKLDDLEASFVRVTADLASQHAVMQRELQLIDRRVVRLEAKDDIRDIREPNPGTSP